MQKRSWYFISTLVFLNLVLFISCTKEEENSVPVINMYAPQNGNSYQFGDTISVEAAIFDDQKVTSIQVQLKDLDNIPKISKSFVVNSSNYELFTELVIDNPEINGEHYVEIRAYDGSDHGTAYRYVTIGKSQTSLDRIYFFDESNDSSSVSIHVLEGGVLQKRMTISNDFLFTSASFNNDLLYLVSQYQGRVQGIDTSMESRWVNNYGLNPAGPYFLDAIADEENIVASKFDSKIEGYDVSGNKICDIPLDNGHVATKIWRHEDLIIYEDVNAQGFSNLQVDYFPNGQSYATRLFEFGKIAGFASLSQQYILIVSRLGNKNIISRYNLDNNGILKLYEVSSMQSYKEVHFVSSDKILLMKKNEIDAFNPDTWILSGFQSVQNIETMTYVEQRGELYVLAGDALHVLDPQNGKETGKFEIGIEAESFELDFR